LKLEERFEISQRLSDMHAMLGRLIFSFRNNDGTFRDVQNYIDKIKEDLSNGENGS